MRNKAERPVSGSGGGSVLFSAAGGVAEQPASRQTAKQPDDRANRFIAAIVTCGSSVTCADLHLCIRACAIITSSTEGGMTPRISAALLVTALLIWPVLPAFAQKVGGTT